MDYNTYIFDLDDTLWSGHWAKMLVGDLRLTNSCTIKDELGNELCLNLGVKEFFREKYRSCNIGFVSRGGLLNIDKDDQPSIKVLRTFGILDYFNYCRHTIYKTEDKGKYVIPNGRTLYIDDNDNDLRDVLNYHKASVFSSGTSLDVINANEFTF